MFIYWSVKICSQTNAILPGTFRLVLLKVNIQLETFFKIEDKSVLTHDLLSFALTIIQRLTIIHSLDLCKIVVYVLLNECVAVAPGFDERYNVRLIIRCSRFAFEIKLVLPLNFDGWHLI